MEFNRSFRLSRSHHILLSSESVISECAKIAGYERLSQSLRLSGEYDFSDKQKNHKRSTVGLLGKVFSFRRVSTPHGEPNKVAETVVKKEKKRSSWLPDPDRRWPIQGWWCVFLLCLSFFGGNSVRLGFSLVFVFSRLKRENWEGFVISCSVFLKIYVWNSSLLLYVWFVL